MPCNHGRKIEDVTLLTEDMAFVLLRKVYLDIREEEASAV